MTAETKLPQQQPAGREGQYSSISATAELPPRGEQRYSEEEVHITREEERYRRPGFKQEEFHTIVEERRYVKRSFLYSFMALFRGSTFVRNELLRALSLCPSSDQFSLGPEHQLIRQPLINSPSLHSLP